MMPFPGYTVVVNCDDELKAVNSKLRAALERECAAHRATKEDKRVATASLKRTLEVENEYLDKLWAADARNDVQEQEIAKLKKQLAGAIAPSASPFWQREAEVNREARMSWMRDCFKARNELADDRKELTELIEAYRTVSADNNALDAELSLTKEDLANTELAHAATMTKLNEARKQRDEWKTAVEQFWRNQAPTPVLRFKAGLQSTNGNSFNWPFRSNALFKIEQAGLPGYIDCGGTLSASLPSLSLHDKLDTDKSYDITISESPS